MLYLQTPPREGFLERAAARHAFIRGHAESIEGVGGLEGGPVTTFIGSAVDRVAAKEGEGLRVSGGGSGLRQ